MVFIYPELIFQFILRQLDQFLGVFINPETTVTSGVSLLLPGYMSDTGFQGIVLESTYVPVTSPVVAVTSVAGWIR